MFRLLTLSALFCLCSFRFPSEYVFQFGQSFAVNSKEEHFFIPSSRDFQEESAVAEADSSTALRILMLNYFAYDKGYPQDLKQLIKRRLPAALFTEFWEGSAENLTSLLSNIDCIVVPYPYSGQAEITTQYGKVLQAYARQGGLVLITGTHKYSILQQLDLFDLEKTYYSKNNTLKCLNPESPVLKGVDNEFVLQDFTYPVKTNDSGFQALVDISGFPVAGYKSLGFGKVYYLGFEYYRDESASAGMLVNALLSGAPRISKPLISSRPVLKTEEYWVNGSAKVDINAKIYPNPYISTATLDVDLENPATVSIDMVDQTGVWITTLLSPRFLSVGLYSFDLPNVAPGIYFIRCKVNGQTELRKVVKAEGQ